MRVYLPSTSTGLAALGADGVLPGLPMTGFAVTPGLREFFLDDDLEELEYAAMTEAAQASLRLIAAELGTAAARRVVVSADVEDSSVTIHDDLERGVVRVQRPVTLTDCVSIHVDDGDAAETVARAAANIDAADLGHATAEEAVDDAEGFELLWFATQELPDVLASLSTARQGR